MSNTEKSLTESVEEILYRSIILEERYGPGDKLPNEIDLSKMLGISRSTLREAVRSLTFQGILVVKRGKGTYVSPTLHSYKDELGFKSLERARIRVKDLFEMRLMFEPETTYLACKRASDWEIENILRLGRIGLDLIHAKKDRANADHDFHKAIVLASRNEFISTMIPLIKNAINVAINETTNSQALTEYTLQDHALIMDFIEARDAKGAKYAMTLHLHHAIRYLKNDEASF